jgi:hypothetical protein
MAANPAGTIPPALAAAALMAGSPGLQGGAGPPGPPPGPGPDLGQLGPPPGPNDDTEDAEEQRYIKAAAVMLEHALRVETDPREKMMIAKLVQGVHALVSNRQDERMNAMGASPALKLAIRQSGAGLR